MSAETIHDRLKQARIAANHETATDAAQELQMSYQTYVAHESGKTGVTLKMAKRYAAFFGVSVEFLVSGAATSVPAAVEEVRNPINQLLSTRRKLRLPAPTMWEIDAYTGAWTPPADAELGIAIASRLRAARKAAGFKSAAEAADELGQPYSTYAAQENGSTGLRVEPAIAYASVFGVPLDWLLTGRGA